MPDLNQDSNSKAYTAGRLFATYEQMQWKYSPNLNKDLSQKFFTAALKQPTATFVRLAELGNVYIKNIKGAGFFYKLLGELSGKLEGSFPKSFTIEEQGEFVLGYYQQKADFMKKTTSNEVETETVNDAE